ncbi:hypothetical protein MXM45_19125 [Citrobacter cronae]|nr:hypothetical protein [Citrobacter cronae]MEB5756442.1 hypothetical protein [Citrobacter cronae]
MHPQLQIRLLEHLKKYPKTKKIMFK